jgi:hypothetical protein
MHRAINVAQSFARSRAQKSEQNTRVKTALKGENARKMKKNAKK